MSLSIYIKAGLLLTKKTYESWEKVNRNNDFLYEENPYIYFIHDKNELSLFLNPVCGINHLDYLFLQSSLFKSIELVHFVHKFLFFHPQSKVVIIFDRDIKKNRLLLEKLTAFGCEFLFDPSDWKPFDELIFVINRPEFLIDSSHKKKRRMMRRLQKEYANG